jgi:hypothetical protein
MKMSLIKLALVAVVLTLLGGCRTYEQKVSYYSEFLNLALTKTWQDSVVRLQAPAGQGGPIGNPGDLMILSDNRCKNNRNPHKGCLVFEQNVSGQITFEVNPHTTAKTCGSSPAPHSVIVKIELSERPDATSGDPASKGQFDSPANLPAWVKENAFPEVDRATGIVYEAYDLASGLTRVSIPNLNNHPNIDGNDVRMVWYRVTVQSCNDPTKYWRTDPRDDNEGSTF